MGDYPVNYKIVTINDKNGIIAANHKNKELLVSKDIKLNKNDDGKYCAIFPNQNQNAKKGSDTDCSVTISDPSSFNYCVKKDGVYQLSGSNLTFNGTDKDNALILHGVNNSKINMKDGNDTVMYREKGTYSNDIDLGNGDNIFAPAYRTDNNTPLANNKINSGKGNDYIGLGYARGNKISTGAGKDFVNIEGHLPSGYSGNFKDNLIDMGKGKDQVNISGDFNKFSNNAFYLGEGSDNLSASINPNNDATTELDYQSKTPDYVNTVSNNRIYATDGKKGFFEKNTLETTSYSANQLNENCNFNATSEGFQKSSTKPVPRNQPVIPQVTEETQSSKKLTDKDYIRKYQAASLGAMLFRDAKMQEEAFKALDDLVKSWQ